MQPAEVGARVVAWAPSFEVLQDEVEREEDRDLDEHRQARGSRVDVALPVELHELLVLLLLVALVLLLDLLHLRQEGLHPLHRVDLPDGERDEGEPDDDRETTIDQAQVRPTSLWRWSASTGADARAGRGWRGAEGSRDGSGRASGRDVVDAAAAPRVAAQQPPAREHAAAHEAVLAAAPRSRSASTTGGTCSSPGRACRACSGTRARDRRRGRRAGAGRCGSRRRLLQRLADTCGEPVEPVGLGRLGEARAGEQDVVAAGAIRSSCARQASRSCRFTRLRTTAGPTLRGTAMPTRGVGVTVVADARTSKGRGSASRRTCPGGRRRRSRVSVRGGACAARAEAGRRPSGGQPLPPAVAASLQNGAAGAGRHARAEPVLALTPSNVWLVGAFHELGPESKRAPVGARRQV